MHIRRCRVEQDWSTRPRIQTETKKNLEPQQSRLLHMLIRGQILEDTLYMELLLLWIEGGFMYFEEKKDNFKCFNWLKSWLKHKKHLWIEFLWVKMLLELERIFTINCYYGYQKALTTILISFEKVNHFRNSQKRFFKNE